MRPIDERGGDAYFNKRYGPQTNAGKMLGNTKQVMVLYIMDVDLFR
jgi:hypothetical protein